MNIREHIADKLIDSGGFWSYDKTSVRENIDLDDIDLLFRLFSAKKIKDVWLRTMVVQGDYYYSLNRFFAWYYFGIRYPDRYLKAMMTRHLSKLTA